MKKSIFSALCLVLLATTTQSAWGATVTFSPSDYSGQGGASGTGGEASATKSGITITSTKAYVDGTTAVREYKNGTITISSTSTITSVVVTGTTTAYGTAFGSGGVSSGTWNAGTWTGSATSITFTAGAQARWKKITITYESGTPPTTVYLGLFLAAFVAVRFFEPRPSRCSSSPWKGDIFALNLFIAWSPLLKPACR